MKMNQVIHNVQREVLVNSASVNLLLLTFICDEFNNSINEILTTRKQLLNIVIHKGNNVYIINYDKQMLSFFFCYRNLLSHFCLQFQFTRQCERDYQ